MISDGLGPSGLTMAREYLRMMGKRVELMDSLDDMLGEAPFTYWVPSLTSADLKT